MSVRVRFRIRAGVLLAALAAGGCAGGEAGDGEGVVDSGTTAVSTPASAAAERDDAAAALAASLEALKRDSYRYTSHMGVQGSTTGLVDPATSNMEFFATSRTPGKESIITIRKVDGVVYVKVERTGGDTGPADKSWYRLSADSPLNAVAQFDPSDVSKSLGVATGVQWVDADTVKGTIDLTKVTSSGGANTATSDPVLTSMPFEASFDDAGRLAGYRFTPEGDTAKAAAGAIILFSEYGVRVDEVKAPLAAKPMPT
jgi:hypothetical protein